MPNPYNYTPAIATPVAAVTKRSQIVLETTPGTTPGSPTWKRMPTLMITPSPAFTTTKFRGQGFKYPSQVVEGKEWVTAKYEGAATFAELCYILSSYGKPATITTIGTTAKKWAFVPDPNNPDGGSTYSLQHGDSTGGWSTTWLQFASVVLNMTRDAIKVSGDCLGQYWNTGITLGSSPTTIENVPLIGNTVDVGLDTSFANIGNTQIKSPFEIEISLPNKFQAVFPLNTAAPGHAGTVEIPTEPTVKMKIAADAASDALIGYLRGASVIYMQIDVVSAVVADVTAPTFYSAQFQMPLQVGDGGGFSEDNGVYVAEWTNNIVVDTANNFIWKANLVNKMAAL